MVLKLGSVTCIVSLLPGVQNSPYVLQADTNNTNLKSNLHIVELQNIGAGRGLGSSGLSAAPVLTLSVHLLTKLVR